MMSYQDLRKRLQEQMRSRSIPAGSPYDFSNVNVESLAGKPVGEVSKIVAQAMAEAYAKVPEFKKLVEEDYARGKDHTYRLVYNWLEDLDDQLIHKNKDGSFSQLMEALKRTGPVAQSIIKNFREALYQVRKEEALRAPVRDVKPLSVEELADFGIDGLLNPKITDEEIRDAIRTYRESTNDGLDAQTEKIERFRKNVEIARNIGKAPKSRDLLTDDEAETYFSNEKGYGIKSVQEITPAITEEQVNALMQNLLNSRKRARRNLDKKSKTDLLHKLFNTVLAEKEKAYANPEKYPAMAEKVKADLASRAKGTKNKETFIDRLRDKRYINNLIDHAVTPRASVEMLKDEFGGLQQLTDEEREEFLKLQKERARMKVDDPARALTVAMQMLIGLRNYEELLENTNITDVADRTLGKVIEVLPDVGLVEDYLDTIEAQLSALGVSNADIPYLLPVENGTFSPESLQKRITDTRSEYKNLIKKRNEAESQRERSDIEKKLKELETRSRRFVRLSKLGGNKKALYDSVRSYFDFLEEKEADLKNIRGEVGDDITALEKVLEGAIDMYTYFRDLARQKEYRGRWELPGAITDEEKARADEMELNTEIGAEPTPKVAVDISSYQKGVQKFRDGVVEASQSLEELKKQLELIKQKTLSILEAYPGSGSEFIRSINTKDLRNNPYGGKGPNIQTVLDAMKDTVTDLRKIDIQKKLEQAQGAIDSLRNIKRWVKVKKEGPSTEERITLASDLRFAAERILEAAKRRTAPSNIPQGPDIGFYRQRGTRKIPNFLIQDSTGQVKKLIEHLEKNWEDYTSDDPKKAGAAIDDAIEKVLNAKGSLNDWMGNRTRQVTTAKANIKKAQEELQKIKERQIDTSGKLESLKEKYIPALENLVDFIQKPLTRIAVAIGKERDVREDRGPAPAVTPERVQEVKGELKDLFDDAAEITSPTGMTLLERIQGRQGIRKSPEEKYKQVGGALAAKRWPLMMERLEAAGDTPINPVTYEEAKDIFLKKFNQAFGTSLKDMPTDEVLLQLQTGGSAKTASRRECIESLYEKEAVTPEEFEERLKGSSRETPEERKTREDFMRMREDFERKKPERERKRKGEPPESVRDFLKTFGSAFGMGIKLDSPEDLVTSEDMNNFVKDWVRYENNILNEYNQFMGRDPKEERTLPTKAELERLDLAKKESFAPKSDEEKDWLERYNALTGRTEETIPTLVEIKADITRMFAPGSEARDEKGLSQKEKAFEVFKNLPKNIREAIERVPASVQDRKWYKEIQRDRSHHKTRWIERIFDRMGKPPKGPEDYSNRLEALSKDVAIASQEAKKAGELDTQAQMVRKNLNDAFMAIIDAAIQNKPLENVFNLQNFKSRVVFPAKNLLRSIDDFRSLMATAIPLIVEYQAMSEGLEAAMGKIDESELQGLPEAEAEKRREELQKIYEDLREKSRKRIKATEALIAGFMNSLDGIAKRLELVRNEIVPLFQDALEQFNSNKFKQYVASLPDKTPAIEMEKMVRELYNDYKKAVARGERAISRGEKEQIKIAAASRPDSYGGADKSPYEIALDTKEVKQDLGPIKGRVDAYNKLEKTIQYLKGMAKSLEQGKIKVNPDDEEELSDALTYITTFGDNAAEIVTSLRSTILPGMKKLLTQQVDLLGPKGQTITTNLEKAVEDFDNMMHEYTSKRTKLINRLQDLERQRREKKDIVRDFESFFDEEGNYRGLTEKEQKIMTRFFLRLMYKYLDELWAKHPGRQFSVTGDRAETPNYLNIWKRFQNIAGPRSNRQLMGLISSIKADIRPGEKKRGIRFKGDELQAKYNDLVKRYRELGQDPKDSAELKDLENLIDWLKEKEKAVDKVFAFMRRTSDLEYLAEIKDALRARAQAIGPVEDEAEFIKIPEGAADPIREESKKNAENVDQVIEKAKTLIEKEKPLPKMESEVAKQAPIEAPTVDKVQETADKLISELDEALASLGLMTGKESYRQDKGFNPTVLYGPLMQRTMRELLKREM